MLAQRFDSLRAECYRASEVISQKRGSGTLSLTTREVCSETVTSAKGEEIDAWYSGKKHRPGANFVLCHDEEHLP
jgi:hypothetical protein